MLFPMGEQSPFFAASSLARLRTTVSLIHIPMIWMLPSLDGLGSPLCRHRQENEHPHIRTYVCMLGMAVSVRLRAIQYPFPGWHRSRIFTQTYRKPKNRMPPCFIKRKISAKRTQAECEAAHHSPPSHANAALNSRTAVFGCLQDGLRYGHAKSPQKRFCGLPCVPCVLKEFCKHSLPGQMHAQVGKPCGNWPSAARTGRRRGASPLHKRGHP